MFASKDLFLTQPAGATGYQISRSVRLRSSASAYFNRTLSTPTSNTTWTFSCWLKRGALSNGGIFAESTGFAGIYFASDKIRVMDNAGGVAIETTAVYRDPSAWANFVVRSNGTNIKVYWNSVEVGSYTGTITLLNAATSHFIGRYSSNYFDGYLAEINFIDGQALTPSSFGATSTTTGVWGPAKYTGTYGTNGFYLNFSDNSAATAAAIGKDSSGNGNNWTPNNISVTAGTTYDSMVDTPTPYGSDSGVGGEVRGNYATLNPIDNRASSTINNGNLDFTTATSTGGLVVSTISVSSGKWYVEFSPTSSVANECFFGIENIASPLTSADNYVLGNNASSYAYRNSGSKVNNGSSTAYGASFTTNDVIGVALDLDAGTLVFYKNGSSQGTAFSSISGTFRFGANDGTSAGGISGYVNFGQRAFAYTAPSGYKALNTQNLPTPTIANGAGYMAATLYTGTGASQTIANTVGSANFKPDWVWIKSRSGATNNELTDSVRGTTKALVSNSTAAESTDTNGLTAFGSTGFTVGTDTNYNNNTATYVAWQWLAGAGSSSSNTSGSITSTVSVNQTAGFSVVTYTGNGGSNQSVGHGLGVTPGMVIIKDRTLGTTNWLVHHQSQPTGYTLYLNLTNAQDSGTSQWGTSAQTSSVFYIGYTAGATGSNNSGDNYVAYCFAPIAGYSAFGSYTGNGSTDGPFVYTGFRPRWIMFKRTDNVGDFWIFDTSRDPYNVMTQNLYADTAAAEANNGATVDYLSNGFKLRIATFQPNTSGGNFIYAAFAENPFKYALAR